MNTSRFQTETDETERRRCIENLPKVELHVHLEGAIRPETLLILAKRNNVDLRFPDAESIRSQSQFDNLSAFMKRFDENVSVLCKPEDFSLITKELGLDAWKQNTRYLEVTFSAGLHAGKHQKKTNLSFDELMDAIAQGAADAKRECGIEMRFIIDHDRDLTHYPGPNQLAQSLEEYWQIATWCLKGKDRGVVALGLGGYEREDNMASAFKEVIGWAQGNGIHFIPHAGEVMGPKAIWDVIELTTRLKSRRNSKLPYQAKLHRIGHGVCALRDVLMNEEDDSLIRHLKEWDFVLEICPTSNMSTRCTNPSDGHLLRALWDKHIKITINSDDPGIFNTTLSQEYWNAYQNGLKLEDLAHISLTAIQSSLLPEVQRKAIEETFYDDFRKSDINLKRNTSTTKTLIA